jgi:hypothetical protein
MVENHEESSPPAASDDADWAEVLRRWDDEDAHRAYLDSHPWLEGLAQAGRRYKEVLDRRPDDPVALRWRDEAVRRAAAVALARRANLQTLRGHPLRRFASAAVVFLLLVATCTGYRLVSSLVAGKGP